MTCSDCTAMIPAFLDGTLAATDHERMVSHVQGCDACRLRVHQALNARGYISCRDVVDLVSAYLEETLSRDERVRFEQHLTICPPCRIYVDQMRQTIETVGALSEEHLPQETRLDLLVAFRDWISTEPS